MTSRQPLAAAGERRANPAGVFGDLRFEYPGGVSDAERAAAAAFFQSRADEALRLAGLAAPRIEPRELMRDYRRRLLREVQTHCDVAPEVRKVPPSQIPREALGNFETLIIRGSRSAAVERFKDPSGPLRSTTCRDHSGRESTMWFGDEREAWEPFTNGDMRGRIVTKKGICLDGAVPVIRFGRTSFDE